MDLLDKIELYVNEDNLLKKMGRKMKIATTEGKPDTKSAPKWAKFLGQTPDGAYHWLSNDTPVEADNSDEYFPNANKTQFTGFMGKKSKTGSVEKIK